MMEAVRNGAWANGNSAKSRFVTALTSEGGIKTEIGFGSDFYGYDIRFICRDYNGWGSVIQNNSSNDFVIGHHGNNGEGLHISGTCRPRSEHTYYTAYSSER